MRKILLAVLLCSISAWAQIPDCSQGTCAGVGVPSIACHPGNKYAQVDAAGTNWTCTGIPPHWVQDAGGGNSVTLENVYAAPGSFTFAHNLNSVFYQIHCVTRSGGAYAPATWTDFPVDANDATVTVPGAGDYICSFNSSGAPPAGDFNIAVSPSSQTFWPTMTGTQQPTFGITQSAVGGYSGTATYTTSGLASGMTGAYSPTTITGSGSNTLTLSFPANQAAATTSFTVQGADGTHTHTANPSITVGNINSGLIACWAMNDGSGTTFADSCGTSNPATVAGNGVTWQSNSGLPGVTPLFGSTAYATTAANPATNFTGTAPFSISTWVNLPATAGDHTLLSTLNATPVGWEFEAHNVSGNTYYLQTFLINAFPSFALETHSTNQTLGGGLHYVVETYDGSQLAAGVKFYLDGTLLTSNVVVIDTLSGHNITPGGNPAIGARPAGNNNIGIAAMAYTRVYNRVLSQADITNYFAAGAR